MNLFFNALAIIAWATILPATAQGVDRVPQDYPTIQTAITYGTARTIAISPGHWAGADVTRPVTIHGNNATIDTSVPLPPLPRDTFAGLTLRASTTSSTITDFTFDCSGPQMDMGVFSSRRSAGA